ncbi:EAL domain-containing protein [Alteromonas gilva]|uniref:EAL domain-containing protein n=1 Tax=Alteromonas gilva TaxID=2987522 RepID=A0ABT5L114_9ALTE|nr:EAL domain-containing protein [Alteromonas gilva]MDC8830715.1 EAL domain-containing protein [Alteromonas gilva]
MTSVLSTQQGLVQDSVADILIDNDGFVWIATDGGLDRYDGYRVEHITGNNDELASTPIETLFLDSNNRLWIGTQYRGVYMLDLNTSALQEMSKIPSQDFPDYFQLIEKFFELPDGNLLMLSREQLIRFDVNTKEHKVLHRAESRIEGRAPYLRDFILTDGLLVLATSEGLYTADYSSELAFHRVEHRAGVERTIDNANTKKIVLNDDTLWVGTVTGLFSLPWDNVKQAHRTSITTVAGAQLIVKQRNIWQIRSQSSELIWLGTDIGLLRLSREKGIWQWQYVLQPSTDGIAFSHQNIRALVITPYNDLWLGSYFNGAIFWSPKSLYFKPVQNYTGEAKVLSDNVVWAIYEDEDRTLWVGTDNGLTHYNERTGESEFYIVNPGRTEQYSIHNITKIIPLPDDKLLLSTLAGLLLFDRQSKTYERLEFGLEEEEVIYLAGPALDSSGQLYFFGDNFYRYDFNDGKLQQLDELEAQIPFQTISNFIGPNPIHTDEMLVATYDGLWSFNTVTLKAKQIHRLPERLINTDFWPDKVKLANGVLWVVYPGYGLVGLDAQTYQQLFHYGHKELGQGAVMFDLLRDDDGYFWFSSLNGIHRFSAEERLFVRYEYGRELSIAEFNQGANQRLRDGRIVFGSPKGLLFFDPQTINKITQQQSLQRRLQEMVITGVNLASRQLNLPKKNLANTHVHLNHDDYGLSIEFSGMDFYGARDTNFKYMLRKNGQVISEDVTRDTKVILPSLAAGEYRFDVFPVSQFTQSKRLPASLSITMDYPPFLSPVAYTLYAVIIVTLIGAYLFSRHVQLMRLRQAQQQVKLFGNAFRHTSDWVVIFDEQHNPVAANPAFEQAFGLTPRESLDRQLSRLYQQVPKLESQLSGQLHMLVDNQEWKGEERIQMPDGREYDVLVDINRMSEDNDSNDTHYLVVISNITEQKNAERKLVKIANYDNLTGLVNRSLLLDRLEHAISSADTHNYLIAVLFVDLDRFKGINDSLGHDYGDKLLRVVANRMVNQASKSDTVARLGGDEFVIVMEEVEQESTVSSFVSQLIESIETPISLGKEVLRVSCSVGISFYPNDGAEPAELLKQADVAMYAAKKSNVAAFTYFTKEMNERAVQRLELENIVKSAFEQKAFQNFYQPIVNLATGKTEGVELLMRCHFNDEWIPPAAFIPVLEELRHIIELTRASIATAVTDLRDWYAQGFEGYVSINLSALHFKTHFDLDYIEELLRHYDLPHSALRFEITESVLMDKSDGVLHELNRFRDAGFKLALDDFGTGYSSLSYLRRFPLDILKIDKSFIDDVKVSEDENALVLTTINLASSLDMDCIAEGIEHPEQVRFLLNHGCPRLQGYYFSHPVDNKTVQPLLFEQWLPLVDKLIP